MALAVAGIEMHAHVEVVVALRIVEITDPFEVLRLVVRHVVPVGDHIDPGVIQIVADLGRDPSRLVNFIEPLGRHSSDLFAVAGADDNLHD